MPAEAYRTATLADGTPFELDLNTLPPSTGDDFVDFGAMLSVTLIAPGDFDIDGDVDGFDFLKWQRSFGVDDGADFDGDTDENDLLIWQSGFGQPAALASSTAAAPEPSSILLAMAALLSARFARWR